MIASPHEMRHTLSGADDGMDGQISMADAFISYRRKPSAALAQLIRDKLKYQHKLDAYLDTSRTDSTQVTFPERLMNAITETNCFICVLGDTTLESEWVQKEIQRAYELNKFCIPVFQEAYIPPTNPTPAINYLLNHDGVHIFDLKNVMVDESVTKIAALIPRPHRRISLLMVVVIIVLIIFVVIAAFAILSRENNTLTSEPTQTPSPTLTTPPTDIPTNQPPQTVLVTQTDMPTRRPTFTPHPTRTSSMTPSRTPTRTPRPTNTSTRTPTKTRTLTPTRTPSLTRTPIPTRTPSATPVEQISTSAVARLFEQDFTDNATGISRQMGRAWRLSDVGGNQAYCNSENPDGDYDLLYWGNAQWDDYIVQLDLRFIDATAAEVYTRYDGTTRLNAYRAHVNAVTQNASLTYYGPNDFNFGGIPRTIITQRWYTVRVELNNNHIRYWLGDQVIADANTISRATGYAGLLVTSGQAVCIDNIHVWSYSRPQGARLGTATTSVDLRRGPGPTYTSVGRITVGESLVVIARSNDNSWLRVRTQYGVEAWVSQMFVQTSGRITSLPLYTP